MYGKERAEKAAKAFIVALGVVSWMLQELQIKEEYVLRYDACYTCGQSALGKQCHRS